MAGNAQMTIFIGGDNSDFLKKWESTKRAMRKGLGSEATAMSESIVKGFAAAGAAMLGLGIASIKMAGDMQANKRAFTTLLGDAGKAEKFLNDLAKFASETPFELPGLTVASKKLLAFGFAAEDIIPIMASIGDAAAMLGIGQEGIDRLTLAIGQMQAKGKVSGEEMRQLAEAGIPAWKFLADAMGISIPEAMDKAEKGAIDSTTGINAILMGMQNKFKGGMAGLSQEIPGLFSTIKDNVVSVMREMGDKIAESIDLKEKMKSMAETLEQFAAYVKTNGINSALRDLVPKELSLSIFLVAGALAGAAIPAIISFGIALWTALVPLLPFIAAGAALGAVAWVIWQAWEPISDLFMNTWTTVVNYTKQKWAELKILVYGGVQKLVTALMPLLNLFGGGLRDAAAGWLSNLTVSVTDATEEASEAAKQVQNAGEGIDKAFSNIGERLTTSAQNLRDSTSSLNTTFKGLSVDNGIGTDTSSAASGKLEKDWDKLVQKAAQITKSIQDEWVQTTKTELEQLELWKEQQLSDLEETKAANENYQRDLLRLEAVYSVRRIKILEEEAKKRNSIWDQAADAAKNLANKIGSIGKSGVVKEKFDIEKDASEQIDNIARKYRDWALDYSSSTAAQKEEFIKAWKANGIAFEISANEMVDFSRQVAAEQEAIEAEKNQKLKDLYFERVKFEEELEQARKDGDISLYQELLNKKEAIDAQSLAGRQAYIDKYYEIWKNAHRSAMSYMAEGLGVLYDGTTELFSGIIDGTKTIGEAFQDLGKAVLKMINSWVAEWLSARIMMGLFGSISGTKSVNYTSSAASYAIPSYASGGEYKGGLALVGEKGPELINFNTGGHILNAASTEDLLSGSTYQLNMPINVSGDNGQKLAGRLKEAVTELVRQIIYEEARI